MYTYAPQLTRGDRAYRREKIVAAYRRGDCSRTVAALFGVTDGFVRQCAREAGVSRRAGRPAR